MQNTKSDNNKIIHHHTFIKTAKKQPYGNLRVYAFNRYQLFCMHLQKTIFKPSHSHIMNKIK